MSTKQAQIYGLFSTLIQAMYFIGLRVHKIEYLTQNQSTGSSKRQTNDKSMKTESKST